MANTKFEEYKIFSNPEQVKDCTSLLDKNQIEYVLDRVTPLLDPAFAGNTQNESIVIKIKPSDFELADKVLHAVIDVNPDELDPDYYLLHFTDDELMDVIVKNDEWNDFDYILAQKLLKERGKEVSPDVLKTIRRNRLADLSRHKPFPKIWIIAGYIFSLLGGLIGIFIGIMLISEKKALPNGKAMNAYDSKARIHGKAIFTIGIIMLILTVLLNKISEFNTYFR